MERFPYTNPYSQPEKQLRTIDEALDLITKDASTTAPQIWLAIVNFDEPWKLPQVLRFTKYIVSLPRGVSSGTRINESCCWVIHWLVQEGRWDASDVYAATTAMNEDNTVLLLPQYLQKLVAVDDDPMLQAAALSATISIFSNLRRIQSVCCMSGEAGSSDCCWFREHLKTESLLSIAQRGLMVRQDEWTPTLVRSTSASTSDLAMSLCDFKACCAESLAQLSSDCDVQEFASNQDLIRRLHQEASRLKIFYTPFSLSCLHLLSLLCSGGGGETTEFEKLLNELLPFIVRSAFPVSGLNKTMVPPGGPRWNDSASTPSLRLLEELLPLRVGTIGQVIADHGRVEEFVSEVVSSWSSSSESQAISDNQLERLLFLHRCCRCMMRHSLSSALRGSESSQVGLGDLMEYLFHFARTFKSVYAVVLCRELVMLSSHNAGDDLQQAMTLRCEGWLDWIVELSTTLDSTEDDYHRPLLILCCDMSCALEPAQQMQATAAVIESFVALVVTASTETSNAKGCVANDGDTPTAANNRSRIMDQSMTWVEEKKRVSRGMDPMVRLVAANVLGKLATFCSGALLVRALEFANGVAVESHKALPSTDMFRRRLRLWATLSCVPGNEQYLSCLLYANASEEWSLLQEALKKSHTFEQALEESNLKCNVLIKERDSSADDLSKAKFRFQRKAAEVKLQSTRESNALVQMHVEKFSEAEEENLRLASRLQEVEHELELTQESEKYSRVALEESNQKLAAALQKADSTQQSLEANEAELRRCNEELATTKQQLLEDQAKGEDLEKELEQEQDHITDLEASENELREGLENLFGDMVSLARMYEFQENKIDSSEESLVEVSRLRRKLQELQQTNKELTDRQAGIKYDNELLQRKYEKVREKLEKERDDRRREDEQRRKRAAGPISYMNQLHNESTSRSSKSSSSISKGRRGSSKENRAGASSSHSRSQKR